MRRRNWIAIVVALLLVSGTLWIRMSVATDAAFYAARDAEKRGETTAAIGHYQVAASAWAPGLQRPAAALDALDRIATKAEAKGQRDIALEASWASRGAIRSTRWLFAPFDARLASTDARLARMQVSQRIEDEGGGDAKELQHYYLELLKRDLTVAPILSFFVLLAFVGWLVSVQQFFKRGLSEDMALNRRPALVSGMSAVFCLMVWLTGLYHV